MDLQADPAWAFRYERSLEVLTKARARPDWSPSRT